VAPSATTEVARDVTNAGESLLHDLRSIRSPGEHGVWHRQRGVELTTHNDGACIAELGERTRTDRDASTARHFEQHIADVSPRRFDDSAEAVGSIVDLGEQVVEEGRILRAREDHEVDVEKVARVEDMECRQRVCEREKRRQRLAREHRLALDIGARSCIVEDRNVELATVEAPQLLHGPVVQDPRLETRVVQPQRTEKREQSLDGKVWVTPDA
jgi:hypothetical protein